MTFKEFVGTAGGTEGVMGALNVVIIPTIITFASFAFVFGVVHYFIINGNDESKQAEGRQFVMWGILGLTLLFSVWGVVNLALSTLGITPT